MQQRLCVAHLIPLLIATDQPWELLLKRGAPRRLAGVSRVCVNTLQLTQRLSCARGPIGPCSRRSVGPRHFCWTSVCVWDVRGPSQSYALYMTLPSAPHTPPTLTLRLAMSRYLLRCCSFVFPVQSDLLWWWHA